jgi:mono/diheme cytochrome c family protein
MPANFTWIHYDGDVNRQPAHLGVPDPPIDEAKAQQGQQIFAEKCAGCHREKLFAQMQIATDPNRANSFGQPVGKIAFPAADGISPSKQAGMDATSAVWRATGQYAATRISRLLGIAWKID